ncbi:DUF5993 family protein [Stappia sp.]|jgi:hypothetical protein|uniref:DUF5993 family protein n=1 Tax=Stappia sp. TaxID=1870903 RepID=UPI003A9A2972
MFLTALFTLLFVTLCVAAYGPRKLIMPLAGVSFVVAVLVYMHHATDALPLSF